VPSISSMPYWWLGAPRAQSTLDRCVTAALAPFGCNPNEIRVTMPCLVVIDNKTPRFIEVPWLYCANMLSPELREATDAP